MAVYRTKVCFSVAAFMTADFQRSLDQVKRKVFFKKGNQIDVLISDKVLAVYLICIAIAAKFIVRLSPHKTNTPIVPKYRWATHPLHSSHPFALISAQTSARKIPAKPTVQQCSALPDQNRSNSRISFLEFRHSKPITDNWNGRKVSYSGFLRGRGRDKA